MIVFHGTASYTAKLILKVGPIYRPRKYLRTRRSAFCTTSKFSVAELFALRRTDADSFTAGKISGVVIEFELTGVEGRDYLVAEDRRTTHEEHEICVLTPRKLKPVAVWCWVKNWERKELKEKHGKDVDRRRAQQGSRKGTGGRSG